MLIFRLPIQQWPEQPRAAESPTTVIAEDTDLLVLLICHADPESHTLYMQSDKKKGTKLKVWDIHWFQRSLGTEMCSLLPFSHAIAGCDTTSHLFDIGKGVSLRQLRRTRTSGSRIMCSLARQPRRRYTGLEKQPSYAYMVANRTKD